MAMEREPSDQLLDEIVKIRKIRDPECIGKEEYSIIWWICNAFEDFENLISFEIDHKYQSDSDVCFISFKCFLIYDYNSAIKQDDHSFVLRLNSQNLSNYPFDLDENMHISLSLIDKNKKIGNTHTKLIKTIDENISTIKFEKFINKDNFYDENYDFNDEFKIHCKIYFGEERNTTEQNLPDDDISTHCQLKVFDDSEELFQNGSDIKFSIGDRKIKAHKHILSIQSPVFKDMIEGYTPEETDMTIEINDVSYEIIKEVLRFIYTGKVNDIKNIAKDIFVAAEKYKINALKILCEEELIKSLSVENISDMLKWVDQCDSENLKTSVINFICINIKDVFNTIKFHETIANLSGPLSMLKAFMSKE